MIIGFLLVLFGMSALVLSLVGIKLSFLTFIDAGGATLGLVIRLLMIFGGAVIALLANHDWASEANENDEYITRNEKY